MYIAAIAIVTKIDMQSTLNEKKYQSCNSERTVGHMASNEKRRNNSYIIESEVIILPK